MSKTTIAAVAADVATLSAEVKAVAESVKALTALVTASTPARVRNESLTVESASFAPETERTQCLGNTAAGARCKRLSGGDFCPSHKGQAKAARKPRAAKAASAPAAKKATKGSKTASEQSRKDFNVTVCAKARLAGGGTYKAIIAAWADVKAAGAAGETPDQIVARYTTK